MADLPVQPVQDYGSLLSSFGNGLANQENASTNALNARANVAQVPSEIANRQAQTGLLGSEGTGKDIENQKAAMMLQLTKNALHNYAVSSDAAAAPTPGADNEKIEKVGASAPVTDAGDDTSDTTTSGGSGKAADPDPSRFAPHDQTAAFFDQQASDKFRVNPAFNPQEQAMFNAGIPMAIAGDHSMLDAAKTQHDQRVQTQTANSQVGAQKASDKLYAINTAPDGTAFQALKGANPTAANHLAAIHGLDPAKPDTWTQAQKDEMDENTRKYAGMVHNSLFQYTGDKLEDKNGQNRNNRTGELPIGDQTQGLSPEQWSEKYKDATSLVTIPDPNGGPEIQIAKWRANGARNANAYIRSTTGKAANAPGSPLATDNTGVGATGTPSTAAPSGSVGSASATTPQQNNTPAPPTVGNLTQDPVLRKALADPSFAKPAQAPRPAGSFAGMSKQDVDSQVARTALLKDSEDATSAAQLSNQYMTAAKQILDSKQVPTTGPFGAMLAKASALLPGQHVDATNYQEVAKYLGNAALAQAKGIYGARMTQSEVGLQLNELSPSVHMTDEAVRNLLDTNIRSAQYTIDSASRVKGYLAAGGAGKGGDPQNFEKWEAAYFPRGQIVNPPGSAGSNAAPKKVSNAEEYHQLPAGASYIDPKGVSRIKGGASAAPKTGAT
jgi:hypothetical protein